MAASTPAPVDGRAGFLVCLGYDDWEPARVIASLAALGYRYCEWSLSHYPVGDQAALRRLVDETERGGMQVSELIAQQDFVTTDDAVWERRVANSEAAIRDAAACGIAAVNIWQ